MGKGDDKKKGKDKDEDIAEIRDRSVMVPGVSHLVISVVINTKELEHIHDAFAKVASTLCMSQCHIADLL